MNRSLWLFLTGFTVGLLLADTLYIYHLLTNR